ncbi:hypothetical protein CNE_1c04210 [Cupriavidus necator N-1]|uniref:Uncharacterized protein n=1 Tax=Cupriavidus necator (strain ATCC 43291 / DSM 13513 / CCUG 52238 / LMG 8453 / N-1) TaxID=1042878 RepID=G0EUS5_CUPNN|nr:hypothetical protein [Cupriavidus necator]AEI75786.1 hypothetical protein CNE_1c04210 [Cupriavidus necator N-1]MDX6012074.1 hypothetical protein [Cupriavidus necator]
MPKQSKSRARNLGDEDLEAISRLLDGWDGKLSWELLIEAIETRLKARYTRQALSQHARIKLAFQLTKERLTGQPRSKQQGSAGLGATEAQALLERYQRLEGENARLKAENERLLEQFVVWAYNASNRGLDARFLSQPLPRVDRDQTKLRPSRPSKL